jgi:hypothetical protein
LVWVISVDLRFDAHWLFHQTMAIRTGQFKADLIARHGLLPCHVLVSLQSY